MRVDVSNKIATRLRSKPYRDSYVAEHVKTGTAYQIRALREERGMSQADSGKLMNKPQSVVSRLEDPDYGKVSLQSLLDVASAYDVALLVKFVTFPTFLEETRDLSKEALRVRSYDQNELESLIKVEGADEAPAWADNAVVRQDIISPPMALSGLNILAGDSFAEWVRLAALNSSLNDFQSNPSWRNVSTPQQPLMSTLPVSAINVRKLSEITPPMHIGVGV